MTESDKRGFASIEVMIAGLLLSSGILLVTSTQMLAARLMRDAELDFQASAQADEFVELFRMAPQTACEIHSHDCHLFMWPDQSLQSDAAQHLMDHWRTLSEQLLPLLTVSVSFVGPRWQLVMTWRAADDNIAEIRRWFLP